MTAPLHLLFFLAGTLPPSVTFAVIGDTQGNAPVFRRAVAQMKAHRVDFAIHLGDMAQCASRRKWREAGGIMAGLGRLWRMVPGNHDVYRCPATYDPRLLDFWRHFWPMAIRFYWCVGKCWSGGGWILVHLNSTVGEPIQDMRWLEKRKREGRPILVFTHRPPGGRLRRLLGPPIVAVFHGHNHRYRHTTIHGVDVYCTGGGGGRLARGGYYHWLLVRLWQNGLTVDVVRI